MTKVVFNSCFGGFGLSEEAWDKLHELGVDQETSDWEISRHDPRLIEVVEALGKAASGMCAALTVAELKGSRYIINEYDGSERVIEPEDLDWISIPAGDKI
jgi:hypothetical protein